MPIDGMTPLEARPRMASPRSGCSILMTSAPQSARTAEAAGTKVCSATSRMRTPSMMSGNWIPPLVRRACREPTELVASASIRLVRRRRRPHPSSPSSAMTCAVSAPARGRPEPVARPRVATREPGRRRQGRTGQRGAHAGHGDVEQPAPAGRRARRGTRAAAVSPVIGSATASAQNRGAAVVPDDEAPAGGGVVAEARPASAPPRRAPSVAGDGDPDLRPAVAHHRRPPRGPAVRGRGAGWPRSRRRPAGPARGAPRRRLGAPKSNATERLRPFSRSKNAGVAPACPVGTVRGLHLDDGGARRRPAGRRRVARPTGRTGRRRARPADVARRAPGRAGRATTARGAAASPTRATGRPEQRGPRRASDVGIPLGQAASTAVPDGRRRRRRARRARARPGPPPCRRRGAARPPRTQSSAIGGGGSSPAAGRAPSPQAHQRGALAEQGQRVQAGERPRRVARRLRRGRRVGPSGSSGRPVSAMAPLGRPASHRGVGHSGQGNVSRFSNTERRGAPGRVAERRPPERSGAVRVTLHDGLPPPGRRAGGSLASLPFVVVGVAERCGGRGWFALCDVVRRRGRPGAR